MDSNIYLLTEGDRAILIDAGTGASSDRVVREIASRTNGMEFLGVLLTHEHFDHCGGAQEVVRRLGGSVMASQACARVIRGPDTMMTGGFLFGKVMSPIEDVRIISDRFRSGELDLAVIPSPGHCPGQVCYHDERSSDLFSGDLIFCDGGVGRWDLPGGDLEAHKRSIKRLEDIKVKALYPGHGRYELDNPAREIGSAISVMRFV